MPTFTSIAMAALTAGLLLAAPLTAQGSDSSDAPPIESFRHEAAGIDFYVEKSGDGPPVVLVPSGQGDCGAYRYLADTLASDFTVITFDMPGFSRSGPPPTWDGMSAATLGNQVAALVESLGINEATFYGSSSGGVAVLALVADHPGLVRHAIVHEPAVVSDVPSTPFNEAFATWFPKVNSQRAALFGGFAEAERAGIESENDAMVLDPKAVKRLGEDYIERRSNNVETWFNHYLDPDTPCCNRVFTAEELNRAPVTVTAGMQTNAWFAASAMVLAQRGDLDLLWIPSKHYPYISVPGVVAEVIKAKAGD
ncbi:MAG: alpha/beta hydrolase [Holophagales bacterium]|nr:alpha/beta hydrolase [Holophagales bacterium]